MSYRKTGDAYIQPQYTKLKPTSQEESVSFSQELLCFLSQHPEFSTKQLHLDFLRYCYDHYINCDPASRDLSIQEKLKMAGEMSRHFMGIIHGVKR